MGGRNTATAVRRRFGYKDYVKVTKRLVELFGLQLLIDCGIAYERFDRLYSRNVFVMRPST